MNNIQLQDLTGEHYLSGVSFDSITSDELSKISGYSAWEDAQRCTFILDDIAYQAIEDPSDGYRSSLEYLLICDKDLVKNTFEPIKVVGKLNTEAMYSTNDAIDFVDVRNGKTILTIGTFNADDYYPYYVAEWMPENIGT